MKMIIELISERMTSPRKYNQETFYKEVQEISAYLDNDFDYILTTMDTNNDDNVKRALIKYIIENDYSLDHIYLILAFKWIIE